MQAPDSLEVLDNFRSFALVFQLLDDHTLPDGKIASYYGLTDSFSLCTLFRMMDDSLLI